VDTFRIVQKEYGSEELERQVLRATKETIELQEQLGYDVITDGEMRRDKYIYGFCRTLDGFDFENSEEKLCRNGAWVGRLPRVVSEVQVKEVQKGDTSPAKEWKIAQSMATVPVKFTLPGPMTIADTVVNKYYESDRQLSGKMVSCINKAVLDLVNNGCKYIQIDEPVLVRYPDRAIDYGIDDLEKCFEGVPDDVTKIVHMCCGYPEYLDQEDYQKAEQDAYMKVAEKLDSTKIDQVSIEDAHRRNDLKLFEKFKTTKVILGVIDVVRSRVETVDEIKQHARDVMKVLPRERLILAPDCGLIFLPDDIMKEKLKNMRKAASEI